MIDDAIADEISATLDAVATRVESLVGGRRLRGGKVRKGCTNCEDMVHCRHCGVTNRKPDKDVGQIERLTRGAAYPAAHGISHPASRRALSFWHKDVQL